MRYLALLLLACSPVNPAPLEGRARQDAVNEYAQLITDEIGRRWQPRQAFRDFPNATVLAGTHVTILWVVVDELGDVVVTDVSKSATGYLDREALRAVQAAGPLAPPPKGLLNRSSRGLVAGFPIQFSVTVPGEPGTVVQGRALAGSAPPTMLKPMFLSAQL